MTPLVLLLPSLAFACVINGPVDASDDTSDGGEATAPSDGSSSASSDDAADTLGTADATSSSGATTNDDTDDTGSGDEGDGNSTIAPPYVPAPETVVDDNVPHGTITSFTMSSTSSAIYPLDIATGEPFDRSVDVYVPQQYVAGSAAPFMVVQDGISFYESTMVPVLDNMIAAGELAPMIAIFVEPGPNEDTPLGQRSFEYDSVSTSYVDFVETELLPAVASNANVVLTSDPEGRAAMGGSSGGAAAFTMGWFRPDLYHRILTYSGSFCDLQPNDDYPDGAWSYHASLIGGESAKPLRVALAVGEYDLDWNTDTDQKRNWKDANDRMAAALADAGYHYRYVYALQSEHIDYNVLQQTLPDTLRWLWQGYPVR
ncbi:MAG TPA: alpha/beta hydrolase-fold protein [Nannocystaceae bacterium]|nr:alpha/beta hydrolase-fold protein [Nannocystaceae bacterium]